VHSLEQSDFGQLYELLCQFWPDCAISSSPQQSHSREDDQTYNQVFSQLLEDPDTAREFLKYVHAKLYQQEGLEGLAASSAVAGWGPQLFHALAVAASVLLSQMQAGASHKLNQQHLLPKDAHLCLNKDRNSSSSSMHMLRAKGNSAMTPPSWLHPLLHRLRPDHVVVLVSQLMSHLAGADAR
jgi:hypothetical protein